MIGDIFKGFLFGSASYFVKFFLLFLLFAVIAIGALYLRKKFRLKYPVIKVIDLGDRVALSSTKAGWFGKNSYLQGLWWSGEEVMKLADGRVISEFSTEDYTDINNRKGLIVYVCPEDQDIVVPINKAHIKNKELVLDIAPATYRDTAVKILEDVKRETRTDKDKLLQVIAWGFVIGFSILALIFIVQYAKHAQDRAAEMLMQAGEKGISYCRELCTSLRSA